MKQASLHKVTDFHTHILPGLDDGSPDAQTSLKMLTMLAQQGVERICLTPHFLPELESPAAFVARRQEAFQVLTSSGSIHQELLLGAETAYVPGISKLPDLEQVCIEGTNVLLLEMPFFTWTQQVIEEVVSLKLERELQVVLVHPERFLFNASNEKGLDRLLDLSLPLQVNAETFCSLFTRKTGFQLLDATAYPLLGTDSHNLTTRKPMMEKARAVIARKMGKDFLSVIDETADLLLSRQSS